MSFCSVGSATDFNTKDPKFDPAMGKGNVFQKLLLANRIIQACILLVLLNYSEGLDFEWLTIVIEQFYTVRSIREYQSNAADTY